jgi:tetratricopeptide (TPR) repeat protein
MRGVARTAPTPSARGVLVFLPRLAQSGVFVLETLEVEIRTLHAILGSERDPDGHAFAPLADAYRRAGEPRKAFGLLTDGLARAPDYVPGHVVSARLYVEQGLFEEGELAARRALDLDPENVSALAALVKALDGAGRSTEAMDAFETLAALEPEILEEESVSRPEPVLDVADLAPEAEDEPVLDVAALAPEPEDEPVWDVAALAPEPEDEPVLDVAALAPEPEDEPVLDVADLAPEPEDEPVLDVNALAPEPENPTSDEPEPSPSASGAPRIYTRTLGELYAKQGFLDRAVEVFRQLRAERPHDPDLVARLEELEARMEGAYEAEDETGDEAVAADSAARESRARERDEELESLARDLAEHRESQPEIDTPFAWAGEDADPDEESEASDTSLGGPSIGRYFDDLLSWSPGGDPS